MRNIALVFGRKNSKGLKNKNIKKILNKPMYSYPIDAAKKVSNIDEIFVSSDNQTILQYGKKRGCHIIKRPKYLCTDKSLLSDAIQHAVSHCFSIYEKIDNFVILLCNSVCFLPKDIKEGLKIINKSKKITICESLNIILKLFLIKTPIVNKENIEIDKKSSGAIYSIWTIFNYLKQDIC